MNSIALCKHLEPWLGRPVLVLIWVGFLGAGFTNANVLANEPILATSSQAQSQTEATNNAARTEQIRSNCIEGRRYIAGRVLQVAPEGLVVDSGYGRLMSPPLNRSWVVSGTATVTRDANAVEENKPDALCVGLVFLSNLPKRPPVKLYDYVVIHGYPAGSYVYSPVAGIQKPVRRFSASLDRAVQINLGRESK